MFTSLLRISFPVALLFPSGQQLDLPCVVSNSCVSFKNGCHVQERGCFDHFVQTIDIECAGCKQAFLQKLV